VHPNGHSLPSNEFGGSEIDLQAIFDDLFEGTNASIVDIDKFCNEIIEEEIASSTLLGTDTPLNPQQTPSSQQPRWIGDCEESVGGGGVVAREEDIVNDYSDNLCGIQQDANQLSPVNDTDMATDDSIECSIVGSDDPILYPPTNSSLGNSPDELVNFGYYVDETLEFPVNDMSSLTSSPSHLDSDDASLFSANDSLVHSFSPSYDFDNAFQYHS